MAHALTDVQRTLVATVVAVAPRTLMASTASALEALRARSALRTILIVPGDEPAPRVVTEKDATLVEGLVPRYLNNAVASLRLSSLPSLAWWRGGDADALRDLANLVDRLVLDSPDAKADWAAATSLHDRASISDLRWTRLTRWRGLLAQFFDVPDLRAESESLSHLSVEAADAPLADLFAAWVVTRMPQGPRLTVSITGSPGGHAMESIAFSGSRYHLGLRLLPGGTCVASTIERQAAPPATRVVPLGDQSTAALLCEELRVRSRDASYEQAVRYLESR